MRASGASLGKTYPRQADKSAKAVSMKIILSRKGFDSSSGGGPSPIVDGAPISLPIPAGKGTAGPSYASLGLSDHAKAASRGKITGRSKAHHDPMFADGFCYFGQHGAAQSHLENQGVGAGDLFLFFGLFAGDGHDPHHRIFGWLWVEEIVRPGDPAMEALAAMGHPHAAAPLSGNDAIWCGRGVSARSAHAELRLSVEQGPPSLWRVPEWMERAGLSYHASAQRWRGDGILQSVARGQEFVSNIGDDKAAHEWLHRMLALMV